MSLIIIDRASGDFLGTAPRLNGLREGGAPILFGRSRKGSLGPHDPENPPRDGQGNNVDHFAVWPEVIVYKHTTIHVGAVEHAEDAQHIPGIQLLSEPGRVDELEAELADLKAWREEVMAQLKVAASPATPVIAELSNAGPSEPKAPEAAAETANQQSGPAPGDSTPAPTANGAPLQAEQNAAPAAEPTPAA